MLCVHVCSNVYRACTRNPEANLWEVVHFGHVNPGERTQVIRFFKNGPFRLFATLSFTRLMYQRAICLAAERKPLPHICGFPPSPFPTFFSRSIFSKVCSACLRSTCLLFRIKNHSRKRNGGACDIAQLVKCLPCSHEDLSLSQNSFENKMDCNVSSIYLSSAGELGTDGSLKITEQPS